MIVTPATGSRSIPRWAFHPALDDVVALLSRHSGMSVDELSRHLYVRYSESAAEHLFSVASGLDSMVVGEQQIIGQIRTAYQSASDIGAAGTTLHRLAQQALHVGKRVHTETGIDSAGASVVSVALDRAAEILNAATGAATADTGGAATDTGTATAGDAATDEAAAAAADTADPAPPRWPMTPHPPLRATGSTAGAPSCWVPARWADSPWRTWVAAASPTST